MDIYPIVLVLAVLTFTVAAIVCDLRSRKLPNWLTVPAFAAAVAFHAGSGAWGGGWSGLGEGAALSLGGFATGFGILLAVWLIGGGGGGDVKFMGALGAWLGAGATLQVFLVAAVFILCGAVGRFFWGLLRGGSGETAKGGFAAAQASRGRETRSSSARAARQDRRRRVLPFAVPAAAATWVVVAFTHLPMVLQG